MTSGRSTSSSDKRRRPDGACATRQPRALEDLLQLVAHRAIVVDDDDLAAGPVEVALSAVPTRFPATATTIRTELPVRLPLVPHQDLDALLGRVEDARTRARQPHALFERRQRLLERQVAALESLDDAAQLREHLIEAASSLTRRCSLDCRVPPLVSS